MSDIPMELRHNCMDFANYILKERQPESCKYGCFGMELRDGKLVPRKCPYYKLELTDQGKLSPVHPIECGDTKL